MDPSGGDLPWSTLPRFLCGAASLAAGRGLGGAGDVLCLVAGRVRPRLSRRCPLPCCWRGGASAEPAVSSASLLGPRGRRCPLPRCWCRGVSSMPAERGLVGVGIVLCLVLGLAKQCLARFIAIFASHFVGGRMRYRQRSRRPLRAERYESSSASFSTRSMAICSSACRFSWRRWWL